MGIGELAGLAAAAFWACSSLFYTRTPLTAWQINFGKNLLAAVILLLNLRLVTSLAGQPLFQSDGRTFAALAISSVIGIVLGDTFYFRSLQLLGPPRALVVSTTSPLFATVLGWLLLREHLEWTTVTGILLTCIGVVVVISERSAPVVGPDSLHPPVSRNGILAGLIGAVLNAGGATFSRLGTSGSAEWSISGCDPLEATVLRVGVAAAASLLTALAARSLWNTGRAAFAPAALKCYLPAVICGPCLGIWMSQVAYKNSPLAVALTLTCTSPIFVMPLTRIVYGTPITVRSVLGTSLALAGVYLTVRHFGTTDL